MSELFEADVSDYSFFTADIDLREKQYFIVKRTSTGIDVCTASDEPYGILQNKPNLGRAAKVRVRGVSRVRVSSAGLAINSVFSSDANGRAVAVTADGSMYLGECFVAGPAVEDALASVSVDGGILHTISDPA